MLDYTVQRAELDPAPAESSRPAWLADRTIELLERYARDAAPWFLRLDFHGPHFPNVVPEPYKSMYDPASIPPWPNAADDLAGKPAVQRIKQQHWRTDRMTWADWQPLVATYFGEISLIDAQVGRVLQRLDSLGLADDTLVIWTTDHGDTIGAHGICNKDYTMYEEIYLVPLIVRWPGVARPAAAATTTSTISSTCSRPSASSPRAPCRPAATAAASCRSLRASRFPTGRSRRSASSTAATWGCIRCAFCATTATATSTTPTTSTSSTTTRWIRTSSPTSPPSAAAAEVLRVMRNRMVDWMARTDDHLCNEWTVLWLTDDQERAAQAPGRRRSKW